MRPHLPPYAERREFHRPFWEMLSAAIERTKKRVFARSYPRPKPLSELEGAKPCH